MTDMEVVRRLDRIINILSNRMPEPEGVNTVEDESEPEIHATDAECFQHGGPLGDDLTALDAAVWVRVGQPVEKRKPMPEFTPEQERRVAAAPKQRPWTPPAEPDPADVDPDEALADVIEWAYAHTSLSDGTWLHVARAARAHIEAEGEHAAMALVREAETDEKVCGDERPGYREWKCGKPSGHDGQHGYGGVFWSYDKLQEHIDEVYDMLNERFSAAKCGSKAEKAIGDVMTFMERNPV